MAVSLLEVLESAGYDLSTKEDALWLVCQQNEFADLLEQANELLEDL